MKLLVLIFGFIKTYLVYKLICCYGKLKNNCPLKFNQIRIKSKICHIHHWIIHLIFLPFAYFIKNKNLQFYYLGLHLGGLTHGLFTYNDWYKLFKNEYKEFIIV